MKLGTNLINARKRSGLSQELVAEKLNVSRQTTSNWELDETIPDIYQVNKLAKLYHLTIDELIDFDLDQKEVEEVIKNIDEKKEQKINWTKAWGKKYPILLNYQKTVDIDKYARRIREMFDEIEKEYGYSQLDAMLVLKDILGHEYLDHKKK